MSRIDVKLSCHGIYTQASTDLPRPSKSVRTGCLSTLACDVCRQEGFGFNFKVFLLRVSPSFRPISFEPSHFENLYFLRLALALEVKKKERRVVSIGPPSRFIGVVHLTASKKRLRL